MTQFSLKRKLEDLSPQLPPKKAARCDKVNSTAPSQYNKITRNEKSTIMKKVTSHPTNDKANLIRDLRKNGPSVVYKKGGPIPLGPTHVQPIPLGLTPAEIKALSRGKKLPQSPTPVKPIKLPNPTKENRPPCPNI